MDAQILRSRLDDSVNFVDPIDDGQALESRYVRRSDDELIVYLSSQTACAQRCRFCHLTTTGQVNARNASIDEIVGQAVKVLEHYDAIQGGGFIPNTWPRRARADHVNFNFMARGEPLADSTRDWAYLLEQLSDCAQASSLTPRFKISTILPRRLDLRDLFGPYQPDIYYSLYCIDESFRQRWTPGAVPASVGLELLREWQQFSHKIPRIHLALIEGQNDDSRSMFALGEAVTYSGLHAEFNIVRYNPPDDRTREGDYLGAADILRRYFPVQIVDRVGLDVYASCGMFVPR